jgi:hypothetical protein
VAPRDAPVLTEDRGYVGGNDVDGAVILASLVVVLEEPERSLQAPNGSWLGDISRRLAISTTPAGPPSRGTVATTVRPTA